jgi:hypothetical protein
MNKHDKDMLALATKYWLLVAGLALLINPVFLVYIGMWAVILLFFLALNWTYDKIWS